MQSHQNKFHTETLQALAVKFAQADDGKHMSDEDKKLWEYFSTLYKNSNKGIKGRGKDRRVEGGGGTGGIKMDSEGTLSSSPSP